MSTIELNTENATSRDFHDIEKQCELNIKQSLISVPESVQNSVIRIFQKEVLPIISAIDKDLVEENITETTMSFKDKASSAALKMLETISDFEKILNTIHPELSGTIIKAVGATIISTVSICCPPLAIPLIACGAVIANYLKGDNLDKAMDFLRKDVNKTKEAQPQPSSHVERLVKSRETRQISSREK
jgi:hypothetical protein